MYWLYWVDGIIAAVACLSTLEFLMLCVLTAEEEGKGNKSLGRVQRVRGVDHFNFPRTSHNICFTMEIIRISLSIQYLLLKSSDEL